MKIIDSIIIYDDGSTNMKLEISNRHRLICQQYFSDNFTGFLHNFFNGILFNA